MAVGGGTAALGSRGMVSSPHVQASHVGAEVLADGGSAADAAVAVAAALAVVYPHMTGIGGDAFWIYHDAADGTTHAYNGSGAAAKLATVEYYHQRGHRTIPTRGPAAALTVPGAVDAWFALHGRFGKLELARLLAPAVRFARDGVGVVSSVAKSLQEEREPLERDEGARSTFLASTATGQAANRLVQPALADSLEAIVRGGRDWFYRGEAAEKISRWAAAAGSPLRADDFAAHSGSASPVLTAPFAGFSSATTPPNSQGVTLLIAQQIMESLFDAHYPADGSAELIIAAVEAAKMAYEERDRHVGDPHVFHPPLGELLSSEFARGRALKIRERNFGAASTRTAGGDTTYFACVDAGGSAASYIQSLYHHFGACVSVPDLGVVLQNRGIAFTLDAGNIRSLVPRRRPFHTLMPAMLLKHERPAIVYGSMGGDAQPQIALALSIRMTHFGMGPQAAIDAPRWRWDKVDTNADGVVAVEARTSNECIRALRQRGRTVSVLGEWEESMGHAGAVIIDRERGVMLGGADPRGDGAAIGIK